MSKTVEANEDGYLTSLTDRLLKVNEEWKNPTGQANPNMRKSKAGLLQLLIDLAY